jgi:hypothetical protein
MKIEFPQIYSFPKKINPLEHSQRLKLTIIRMKTLFTKKNIKINSDSFIPNDDIDFGKATFEIENHIGNLIREYVKNSDDNKLIEIFHFIQFWGGITGRNIYVKNGGFENNFSLDAYKAIVEIAININPETCKDDLKKVEVLSKQIKNIGISFTTKHLSFWSRFTNKYNFILPVLDSTLSLNLLYKCNPSWKDYRQYVEQMQIEASKKNTTVTILERQVYNYFNNKK